MAQQLMHFGRTAVNWANEHPMPVAYAYVVYVGAVVFRHNYYASAPPLDLTTINTTDIDKILEELHSEKHELWVTQADLRPEILGKIYYDKAIDKTLPENDQAGCEKLSRVLDSCFRSSSNKTDWMPQIYESHDQEALHCVGFYIYPFWGYTRWAGWPDIINYYLEWEQIRRKEEPDCKRPWSFCYDPKTPQPKKRPVETPSQNTITSIASYSSPTQVTETETVTSTITAFKSGRYISNAGRQDCPQSSQPFPEHPTRTLSECVFTTTTMKVPVTTTVVKTVTEKHHVRGTPPVVFSKQKPNIERMKYRCIFPECRTSTVIAWETKTTVIHDDASTQPSSTPRVNLGIPEFHPSSDLSKIPDAFGEKAAPIVTGILTPLGKFFGWIGDKVETVVKWTVKDPGEELKQTGGVWYYIKYPSRSFLYGVAMVTLQIFCVFQSIFRFIWQLCLAIVLVPIHMLYGVLKSCAYLLFNLGGSQDPVPRVDQAYQGGWDVIRFLMTPASWVYGVGSNMIPNWGGFIDSTCRLGALQDAKIWFNANVQGPVCKAPGWADDITNDWVERVADFMSDYNIARMGTAVQSKFVPYSILPNGRLFFYEESTSDYIERFLFIVAVVFAVHSYPVVITQFGKHAYYAYQVLVAVSSYSFNVLLCNWGGFWFGDWVPVAAGYLVSRKFFSFTKTTKPWNFDTPQRLRGTLRGYLKEYMKKFHWIICLELPVVIGYLGYVTPCQSLGEVCTRCVEPILLPYGQWSTVSILWAFTTYVIFGYQLTRFAVLEFRKGDQVDQQRAVENRSLLFWSTALAPALYQRYHTLGGINFHMFGSALYLGANIYRFGFGRRVADVPPPNEVPLYLRLKNPKKAISTAISNLKALQKHSVGHQFISFKIWSLAFFTLISAFVGISWFSTLRCRTLNLDHWSSIAVLTSIPSIGFLYKLYCRYSKETNFVSARKTVFVCFWSGLFGSILVYAVSVFDRGYCMNDPVVSSITVLLWSLVPWPYGETQTLSREILVVPGGFWKDVVQDLKQRRDAFKRGFIAFLTKSREICLELFHLSREAYNPLAWLRKIRTIVRSKKVLEEGSEERSEEVSEEVPEERAPDAEPSPVDPESTNVDDTQPIEETGADIPSTKSPISRKEDDAKPATSEPETTVPATSGPDTSESSAIIETANKNSIHDNPLFGETGAFSANSFLDSVRKNLREMDFNDGLGNEKKP